MSRKDVASVVSGAGWIGSFSGFLIDDLEELGIPAEEIHKLGKPTKEGRSLVRACAEKIAEMVNGIKSKFLKLISAGKSLVIAEVDGAETLANANDTFMWIDKDFVNYGADQKGPATGKTPVNVYEMVEDATYSQMFGSLSSDLRKLCLTQAQIKSFVRNHKDWLRTDGCATFFLFESNGHFFVAVVSFYSDGSLYVHVSRFEYASVWYAERRPRLVVPKLA